MCEEVVADIASTSEGGTATVVDASVVGKGNSGNKSSSALALSLHSGVH
jgi:hypothetical protein